MPETSAALNEADRKAILARGLSVAEVERQLALFRDPPRPPVLDRPCTVGDGIRRLQSEERESLEAEGREAALEGRVTKFVPASGAASRMFKDLAAALNAAGDCAKDKAVGDFLENLECFACYNALEEIARRNGTTLEEAKRRGERKRVIEWLLTEKGLNYGSLPKALLAFHKQDGGARTALEEHLVEAALYARDTRGRCRLHFTVSPEHRPGVEALLARAVPAYSRRFDCDYEIALSHQQPRTDTVAVDLDNRPFRSADGSLIFRPGGHGALIENLDALEADIIAIKNIDNVVPDALKPLTTDWKQMLIGLAARLQRQAREHWRRLEGGGHDEALAFVREALEYEPPAGLDAAALRAWLRGRLNRPLRVCGVVRNSGEPGGGPFWVRSEDGVDRQIVESAQVADDPAQKGIFGEATHFNPVDIICAVRDPEGRPYRLGEFVDPRAVFIARKSQDGRELKALERPGLWNGGMAGWNTIFVEVPAGTFNPVKTFMDWLRPEHQTDPEAQL